jgi:hypothetical protein
VGGHLFNDYGIKFLTFESKGAAAAVSGRTIECILDIVDSGVGAWISNSGYELAIYLA